MSQEDSEKEVTNVLSMMQIKIGKIEERDIDVGFDYLRRYSDRGAHKPDVFIIANFKHNNVSDILSTNNDILRLAEAVGIKARKIPTMDKIHDSKLKFSFRT